MILDKERFLQVIEKTNSEIHERLSIGTLKEKTTHLVLKNYIDSNKKHQEVKVKSFVADILSDNQIFEIQTSNFSFLRRKLDVFLPIYDVTVVYPVEAIKYLLWIDEEGNVSLPRKSPRKKTAVDLLPNLVYILPYLKNSNLHFSIFLLESYEYKYLNGWSYDKKKGASRFDRVPISLLDIISIDYHNIVSLLPKKLPSVFSSNEFSKLTHFSSIKTSASLKVLKELGMIQIHHKEKNRIFYQVVE